MPETKKASSEEEAFRAYRTFCYELFENVMCGYYSEGYVRMWCGKKIAREYEIKETKNI
jgi:hypothetical protein